MKKILLLFIAIITIINMVFSQTSDLHNNTNFISFIKSSNELCQLISKSLGTDASNFATAKTTIELLQKEKSISNDEMFSRIKSILKLPVTVDLKSYYNQISYDIENLKNTYGKRFELPYITKEVSIVPSVVSEGGGGGCLDKAGYTLCSAGCFAAAALGYVGCTGTVLGAPFCWALVAVGQTACIQECYRNYCLE